MSERFNFGDERLPEKFWSRAMPDPNGSCWLWIGPVNNHGYGKFVREYAHRVSFLAFKGEIPDGLEVDHLCRVRCCCNPQHLEAVTHRVNSLRSTGVSGRNAKVTHCPRGHEYTAENTIWRLRGNGERECRACANERFRRDGAKHRANQNHEKRLASWAAYRQRKRARLAASRRTT